MIRSMTAFARQERQGEWGALAVEVRSVNHRFLETNVRLPEELRVLEPRIRERIGRSLRRGKVDCGFRYQSPAELPGELEINRDLATKLAHVSREVDGLLYNPAPVNSLDLLRWPGVLQMAKPDMERLHEEALSLLDTALNEVVATREREGESLKEIIRPRCEAIENVVREVRERMPEIVQQQRERLRERLAEVKAELDEARLEQEMVLFAQKVDVQEELDRLGAHVVEIYRVLEQDEPVGRRLDFLTQELNREANTLGSKSVHIENTRAAVELKVLIEQIREQIQNIE